MSDQKLPLAYFITFSTYGTWLPGSIKSYIDKKHNQYATPRLSINSAQESYAKSHMKESPFILNHSQRKLILNSIKEVCQYKNWLLYAAHIRTNHVHCIIKSYEPPEKIMGTIKAYASRSLNETTMKRNRYWTRHGSTKYLWKSEDVALSIRYVLFDQGNPMASFNGEQYSLTLDEFI